MSTEVVHGPRPKFKTPLQAGRYSALVEGRYTQVDGRAAAGVKTVKWASDRPAKRRAELLALRSAFLGFFLETWLELGGTWEEGVACLSEYPYERVREAMVKRATGGEGPDEKSG
jgi:hypothetical protein